MLSIIYLIFMSLIAGILTGIIGMASLTLYPVLLSVGVPPICATVIVALAEIGGGCGTVLSSLKELHGHWKSSIRIAILNAIGGVLGALILIHSSNAGFKKVVPIFILFAGIMLLLPNNSAVSDKKSKFIIYISWISLFLVGMYNGYFGAASGLLMVAVLSKITNEKYVIYNAMRNFSSLINNIVSASLFIFMLHIDWAVIVPLMFGLFVGGYIGPIILRYIPSKYIKVGVGTFAIMLSIYLGYKAYF